MWRSEIRHGVGVLPSSELSSVLKYLLLQCNSPSVVFARHRVASF